MEIKAESKTERISPRKVMLVADTLKNKSIEDALRILMLIRKRGAKPLYKLLKSAVANAVHNAKKNKDLLSIKSIYVVPGPMLKRFRPSTKGRIHPFKKRSSHIKIVLTDDKSQISNVKSQIK